MAFDDKGSNIQEMVTGNAEESILNHVMFSILTIKQHYLHTVRGHRVSGVTAV